MPALGFDPLLRLPVDKNKEEEEKKMFQAGLLQHLQNTAQNTLSGSCNRSDGADSEPETDCRKIVKGHTLNNSLEETLSAETLNRIIYIKAYCLRCDIL